MSDILNALELHELIKLSVLRNAELSAKDAMQNLCELTGAEPVTAIGNRFVMYKRSSRDDVEHIEL